MQKTARTLMMTAALLGLVSTASFAFEGTHVKADIPFAFVAGEKTLPAGSYVFTIDNPNEPTVLGIERADGTAEDFVMTEGSSSREKPVEESRLVFDRYGTEHYLAEVWATGLDEGRKVPMSEIQHERTRHLEHERLTIRPGM